MSFHFKVIYSHKEFDDIYNKILLALNYGLSIVLLKTINYLLVIVDICLILMDDSNVMQKCNEMEAGTVCLAGGGDCHHIPSVASVPSLSHSVYSCTKQLI